MLYISMRYGVTLVSVWDHLGQIELPLVHVHVRQMEVRLLELLRHLKGVRHLGDPFQCVTGLGGVARGGEEEG